MFPETEKKVITRWKRQYPCRWSPHSRSEINHVPNEEGYMLSSGWKTSLSLSQCSDLKSADPANHSRASLLTAVWQESEVFRVSTLPWFHYYWWNSYHFSIGRPNMTTKGHLNGFKIQQSVWSSSILLACEMQTLWNWLAYIIFVL